MARAAVAEAHGVIVHSEFCRARVAALAGRAGRPDRLPDPPPGGGLP